MTDELDDLSKQKIKRATGDMGQVAQGIAQVFANAPAGDETGAITNELHRRGLPVWIGMDLLGWTMGTINFAIGTLFEAGCDKAKALKAIRIVCEFMIVDPASPFELDDFIDELELQCDCNRYECARSDVRMEQAHHAITVSIASLFGMFDSPMITALDRTGLPDDSPQVIAYELTKKTLEEQHQLSTMAKIESILEFLVTILVDSGLTRALTNH